MMIPVAIQLSPVGGGDHVLLERLRVPDAIEIPRLQTETGITSFFFRPNVVRSRDSQWRKKEALGGYLICLKRQDFSCDTPGDLSCLALAGGWTASAVRSPYKDVMSAGILNNR